MNPQTERMLYLKPQTECSLQKNLRLNLSFCLLLPYIPFLFCPTAAPDTLPTPFIEFLYYLVNCKLHSTWYILLSCKDPISAVAL